MGRQVPEVRHQLMPAPVETEETTTFVCPMHP